MHSAKCGPRGRSHNLGYVATILGLSAILLLAGACRKKTEEAKRHFDQGLQYEAQEKLEEAIREYNQAIQLHPNYADAHFHLGRVYQRVRGYSAAWQEYQKVLRIDSNYPKIHTVLGNLYYERGLNAWDRARKLDWITYLHADTLRQLPFKDRDELLKLIEQYTRKVNVDSADAETFSRLSQAYYIFSVEEYQQAIQANPKDTAAQLNLGLAFSEQGYPHKAMAQYETLKRLDPRSAELLLTMIKQKEQEKLSLEEARKRRQQE